MIEIAVHADGAEHGVRFAGGAMHVESAAPPGGRSRAVSGRRSRLLALRLPWLARVSLLLRFALQYLVPLQTCSCKKQNSTTSAFDLSAVHDSFFVRVVMHRGAFGGARFVDDAFEQAANRGVGQRPGIVVLRVFEYFLLAIRLIERQICLPASACRFPARSCERSFSNSTSLRSISSMRRRQSLRGSWRHLAAGKSVRAACFKNAMRSASAAAANRASAARCSDNVAFSISETSAEPTTAASASPPRTETWPGSEIPKPTAIGSFVKLRSAAQQRGQIVGQRIFCAGYAGARDEIEKTRGARGDFARGARRWTSARTRKIVSR